MKMVVMQETEATNMQKRKTGFRPRESITRAMT